MHTTEVIVEKSGALQVTSGIQGLALLKTTQVKLLSYSSFNLAWLPSIIQRFLLLEQDDLTSHKTWPFIYLH